MLVMRSSIEPLSKTRVPSSPQIEKDLPPSV